MKKIKTGWWKASLLGLLGLLGAGEVNGQGFDGEIAVTAGVMGLWDNHSDEDLAGGIEWRLPVEWKGIRPWVGVTAAGSEEWVVGGGLMYRLELSQDWRATVGSGPFYYKKGNTNRDLGHSLEFYSFLEITRRINDYSDIGLRIGHLSNAGFGDRNPGTEILALVWTYSK